jgi:hypothetical protein
MAISAVGLSKGCMRSRHRPASRIGVRLGSCRSLGSRGADIVSPRKVGGIAAPNRQSREQMPRHSVCRPPTVWRRVLYVGVVQCGGRVLYGRRVLCVGVGLLHCGASVLCALCGSSALYSVPVRSPQSKFGLFCNTRAAVVYFSPRLLCRFDLALRAISIRRRIASERS